MQRSHGWTGGWSRISGILNSMLLSGSSRNGRRATKLLLQTYCPHVTSTRIGFDVFFAIFQTNTGCWQSVHYQTDSMLNACVQIKILEMWRAQSKIMWDTVFKYSSKTLPTDAPILLDSCMQLSQDEFLNKLYITVKKKQKIELTTEEGWFSVEELQELKWKKWGSHSHQVSITIYIWWQCILHHFAAISLVSSLNPTVS